MAAAQRVRARCARRAVAATRAAGAAGANAAAAMVAADEAGGAAGGAVAESRRSLVYGLHAINAVLLRSPERLLEIWLAEPRDDARARDLKGNAELAGVHLHAATAESLVKLVGNVNHQGAVAAIRPLKPWDESDLADAIQGLTDDVLLLVLDGVTDPHNLGACLRTAEAAGVHAVIIPKDRSAGVDGVVRKVAAGAADFVPVASVTNLARTLDQLKRAGIWVVGLDGGATQDLFAADLKRPLALVFGAEGAGMRRLTRERCDFVVRIPMIGQMESLNVSVATGVALFEARRQRARSLAE
jgi:23S rRNA (guanosine2251-2'-O)-methyltransferase